MAQIRRTRCCALATMKASDRDTIDSLKKILTYWKKDHDQYLGITTIQCIVTPEEKVLEKNLKVCGFTERTEITRRRCYGTEPLKLYMLELSDYKED